MDYQALPENLDDIRIKPMLDEIYRIDPFLKSSRLVIVLQRDHYAETNCKRRQRLRCKIWPSPAPIRPSVRTSPTFRYPKATPARAW